MESGWLQVKKTRLMPMRRAGPSSLLGMILQNTPKDDPPDLGQLSQPRVDQRFLGLQAPEIAHLISWDRRWFRVCVCVCVCVCWGGGGGGG